MRRNTIAAALGVAASSGLLVAYNAAPLKAAAVETLADVVTTATGDTTSTPTGTTPTTTDDPAATTATDGSSGSNDAAPPQTTAPAATTSAPPPASTTASTPTAATTQASAPAPPPTTTTAKHRKPAPKPVTTDTTPDAEQPTAFAPVPSDLEAPVQIPLGHLVPARLLAETTAAARGAHVPWWIVAGIAEIESGFGTDPGPVAGRRLDLSTWRRFGTDGDGDGVVSQRSQRDRLATLASYLRANRRYGMGIWNRPGAFGFDAAVLKYFGGDQKLRGEARRAAAYAFAAGQVGLERGLRVAKPRLIARILADRSISLEPCHRDDLAAGRIDPQVITSVLYLRYLYHTAYVSSLKCDHPYLTTTGNVSRHSSGDAVDVAMLAGVPILGHQGAGSITEDAVYNLLALPEADTARQIITLMDLDGPTGNSGSFALPDHDDHIHIGY
jgi:membrane-bound lytic murein transglycosylase B